MISAIPEAAVGADVMVGFPGETGSAFEQTLSLIEDLPLAYLHVFPFSPRPGTPAAGFNPRVDPRFIQERSRCLRELGHAKRARFYTEAVGRKVDLVMEKGRHSKMGYCRGISETYIPVWLKKDALSPGLRTRARIDCVDDSLAVFGSPL